MHGTLLLGQVRNLEKDSPHCEIGEFSCLVIRNAVIGSFLAIRHNWCCAIVSSCEIKKFNLAYSCTDFLDLIINIALTSQNAVGSSPMTGRVLNFLPLWQQDSRKERELRLYRWDRAHFCSTHCCQGVVEQYYCVSQTQTYSTWRFVSATTNSLGIPAGCLERMIT